MFIDVSFPSSLHISLKSATCTSTLLDGDNLLLTINLVLEYSVLLDQVFQLN